MHCTCLDCKNLENIDYFVNKNLLFKKDRPFGISSYLLVLEEIDNLISKVEAFIDSVDELIIVVQSLSVNTLNIAKNLASEYPEKIKVFEYVPVINERTTKNVFENPFNVHGIVNLKYFALNLCNYKYALPIHVNQTYNKSDVNNLCINIKSKDINIGRIYNDPVVNFQRNIFEVCTCVECLNGNYDPHNYIANLTDLEIENRAIGISGFARVYNDAPSLEASVKSVIDSIDELMIVVQPCTDNSLEIALKLEQEYPNKIKVFNYKPAVYWSYSMQEHYHLDNPFSVHSFVNYSNFALMKCKYTHVIKIDTDQIYIKEKIQGIGDSYRGKKYKYGIIERIENFLFPRKPSVLMRNFMKRMNKKILKNKDNDAFLYCLVGVHIFKNKNDLVMTANNDIVHLRAFNGGGDHAVFKMNKNHYFFQQHNSTGEDYPCDHKHLNFCLHGGLFWIHTANLKKHRQSAFDNYVLFKDCLNKNYKELIEAGINNHTWPSHFFIKDTWNVDRFFIKKMTLPSAN